MVTEARPVENHCFEVNRILIPVASNTGETQFNQELSLVIGSSTTYDVLYAWNLIYCSECSFKDQVLTSKFGISWTFTIISISRQKKACIEFPTTYYKQGAISHQSFTLVSWYSSFTDETESREAKYGARCGLVLMSPYSPVNYVKCLDFTRWLANLLVKITTAICHVAGCWGFNWILSQQPAICTSLHRECKP